MRYCAATKNRFGWDMDGASNLDELQNKLRESFMIRRLKKDVLLELPDKLRQIIALPENGLASVIKSENLKIKEWEAALEAAQSRLDALDGQEDTPEYADAVRALNSAVQAAFAEMSKLRHDTALAKAPYVAEHVKGLLEEVDKIVVMAHHHDVVDILMDALADYTPVRLTGRDSISNKDAAVQAFQNDPKTRVFVGSILAAGVGLTLTAASTVVFAEMDWVPGNMSQAEDRLHRIGQKDSVLVQHVVVDGSLDARMAQILVEKQAVLDAALDDPTVALDDSSLMAIILGAKKTAEKATVKKVSDEKELSTMDKDEMEAVHLMVQMLAGLCDGAHTLDDVGFNRVDTQFGKQLGMAKSLSPRQTLAAKKMVRKYRRQLPEDLYARVFGATK
jgi:SWI/SNF-related matrix-associated actin-dependent regulator 1 of chromatin subfamily A